MEMWSILTRASCFVAIIIMGHFMRKAGFFKESDFHVLSKIVLKITLPAAIVSSFAGKEIPPSMFMLSLLGLGGGLLYMALGYLMNLKKSREKKAFEVLNLSGYNIGNFTLPFAQSFLGPTGVIVTSLFDVGNAVVCLGGAYSVASLIKDENNQFSVTKILKTLSGSVAFDTYMLMSVLCLLHIKLPSPVLEFAGIIANGNAFMAMLMIGVGFKLSGDARQKMDIIRLLSVRYGIAALLALFCFFVLPFDREIRAALVLLVFSPIASAAPPFTADLKGDIGLSSAVNSMSIVISICCIVGILMIIL